jgi:phospholipid/cholesterol/gamma-HCH transport system substrate-binding protein
MAIFRRNKSGRKRPMTNFRAGLIAVALIALFAYFGFTKTNPFASPPTVTAVFENATGLKPRSPVRIAGVEMGQVKQVTGLPGGTGAAEVTMEVKDAALPLHTDAEAKIRTRIFLEGNFFVDIRPGTPSAPILPEGDPIPMKNTYSPVQLGDVLRVLKSDVRQDLRTLLSEFSLKGLGGGGAEAFNQTIDHMEPAYKSTSVVVDAALGENPKRDLQRVLRGQQRVAAALSVDPGALQGLVTNVNTTAGALAREDAALQASIPALRDLLKRGYPALASLNNALPTLRRFAVEALPGVRSTPRTIDASIPLLRQLRKLFSKPELRGLTRQTRAQIPRLVALNRELRPLLGEARELSSCANNVLLPWAETRVPSTEADNTNQEVRRQLNRSFVGLAGESRTNDGNTPWFRIGAVSPFNLTRADARVEPLPPDSPGSSPRHRPDVPCETQQPPELAAPSAAGNSFAALNRSETRRNQQGLKRNLERMKDSPRFKRMVEQARKNAERKREEGGR